MTLESMFGGADLSRRRLIQTYREEVEKVKNSDFLKDEGEVQKIAQEALEIYRKDKEGKQKDIKEYGFDIMVSCIAGKLTNERMATDFPYIAEKAKELENEEGIKKFISEGKYIDHQKLIWRCNVQEILVGPIGEEVRNKIIPCIAPILKKEVDDEQGSCNIM